jgi:uncharacterized protein YodC (DUF2158 family)
MKNRPNAIKIGDVVILRSDSPHMTVGAIYGGDIAKCVWFVNCQLQDAEFALATLIHVNA